MTDTTRVVFVPGAWLGGWSWAPVAGRVAAAGYDVATLTLPGLNPGDNLVDLTLQDAINHIVDEVSRAPGNVVLVAHSGGGAPAAAAAVRLTERVSRIVFVDAYVPLEGVALNDEQPEPNRSFVRDAVQSAPDRALPLPFEAFAQVMFPDTAQDTQRLLFELLVPEPGCYFLDPLHDVDLVAAGVPADYILAEKDIVGGLPLPGAIFAQRAGVEPVAVPGGHMALMTHPDEVAAAVLAMIEDR